MTPSEGNAPLPELHNTVVVAAFEGWNDAGDAASDAVAHLAASWQALPIVEIDDEAYYDYQVNRPVIRQVDGVTRELQWPAMRISHCRPPGSDRDVVLMCGVEPNMRWRTFCDELLAVIDKLNVDTVVILGALLADTPHTRPVPVSGAAYSAASARQFGLQETRYEGPTGIAGVFQSACVGAGIPAVTFWAAVPHYVSHPPNPKATIALLRRVEDVLDVEVPLADLPAQAEAWEREITETIAEDHELAEYVQTLEQHGDAAVDMNEALGNIDGDALAAEFERYLLGARAHRRHRIGHPETEVLVPMKAHLGVFAELGDQGRHPVGHAVEHQGTGGVDDVDTLAAGVGHDAGLGGQFVRRNGVGHHQKPDGFQTQFAGQPEMLDRHVGLGAVGGDPADRPAVVPRLFDVVLGAHTGQHQKRDPGLFRGRRGQLDQLLLRGFREAIVER